MAPTPATRLVCTVVALCAQPVFAVGVFQVGNSLTKDSKPEGLAAMLATVLDEPAVSGYHIRGNQTLDSLWNNPEAQGTEFVEELGNHTAALPNNHWDYLTLQSFPALSYPTLGEEVARIQDFVGAADQGSGGQTEIIVYGPWPGRGSNWNRWDESVSDDPDQIALYVEAYQELLHDTVAELYPGRVRFAPAGEVMRELVLRMQAGQGPIDSWGDLYRDHIHLTELGRFAASTTVLATITGMNPVGVPVPRDVEYWGTAFTDEQALEIQQIVWEVVTRERRTGISPVGDLNIDTVVDAADYESWRAAYGAQTAITYDLNNDRRVDATDLALWDARRDLAGADLNGDGVGDALDIQRWADEYGATGAAAADLNNDGVVDAADYTVIRDKIAEYRLADLNSDGLINATDRQLVLDQVGWALDLRADANGDGRVDAADYTVWRDAYAAAASASSVAAPEPSAAGLLAAAFGGLLVRRRLA